MSRLRRNKPTIAASILNRLGRAVMSLASLTPTGSMFRETRESQVPIDLYRWFCQRIVGINSSAYWPMHPSSTVSHAKRVHVGIETSPGWSRGCYIEAMNGIYIGDYTQIAPNVGLVSGEHDFYNLAHHHAEAPIRIGKYCLLGMGSVILPGVILGDYTIVGANAVVSKSFPEGFAVLAGNPAAVIRKLDPELRRDYTSEHQYHGYIPAKEFAEFKRKYLRAPS